MRDRELYAKILGVTTPWKVVEVELREEDDVVEVFLEHGGAKLACPECGARCPRYDRFDHRRRSFRHLDTCQRKTVLTADVPRVECDEHGVRQLGVPWAEPSSRLKSVSMDMHAPFIAVVRDHIPEPDEKMAAKMVKRHLYGILNAIALGRSNAGAESINAGIQRLEKMSCGFRNGERLRNAIDFHLGGLDLKPAALQTHTNS